MKLPQLSLRRISLNRLSLSRVRPRHLSRTQGIVAGGVALALLIGLIAVLINGSGQRTVTAQFSSAVGLYKNTPVVILGVPVGKVTKVQPSGDHVNVTMEYDDKYRVPSNAVAVVVANSLVAERYIQLAPVYDSGSTLADGATIPLDRTTAPAEIDDVYSALDKVANALGPKGANANGSLNTLLQVAAANLQGNGKALGDSVDALAQAATTLANGKEDLFGTVRHLEAFTDALSNSDKQVRTFEDQLANVSSDLASERSELGQALQQLTIALTRVAKFVNDNNSAFHTDIHGLTQITRLLVKNKGSLDETLSIAPIALANIIHAYREDLGAIGTRSDLGGLIGGKP